MKIVFGFLLLAFFGLPSKAQTTQDGNYLLGSCQITIKQMDEKSFRPDILEAWRDGLCSGLVAGVMYSSAFVCPADNVPPGQAVRVVVKFLQDHPEKLNWAGVRLAQVALADAFPCGKH